MCLFSKTLPKSMEKLLIAVFIITLCLLTLSTAYDEELIEKGELRKACSRRGNAFPPARRVNTAMRLSALRELMQSEVRLGTHPVDAYIVTSSDEHQSVEVDEYERRREYISGFSGSYGDAIITLDKAVLWTDGRYHLQADEQIDCNWLLMREGHKNIPTRSQWLKSKFPKGARVGVNPKLISEYMWTKFNNEFFEANIELVALNLSLIDEIWPISERPEKRNKDAFVLNITYTGKNYTTKLQEVRKLVKKAGADAMVVTALDEIAWLLNIRGRDIPFSPFVRSYLLFDMDNIFMYVNESQLRQKEVLRHLHAEAVYMHFDTVQIKNYSDIWSDLRTRSQQYRKILVPSHCVYSEGASHAIYEHIFRDRRLPRQSPIIYLKSVKNLVEIEGMKRAQLKDGAAVCDFFAYIETQMKEGKVFKETEMAIILDQYRFEQLESLGHSFPTVVGFASNGAQPHYTPTKNTDAQIFDNNTVVIESGGQYHEGTTSVTRTVHFGEPNNMMKEAYTRVLMGQILFSSLTFPNNMKIAHADILARGPLWEVGLDYLHETGHGVGSFLGQRESPIAIQYDLDVATKQTFKPGYFFTVGPGYYKEGYFGIRLENIFEVVEKPWLEHTSGHKYLGFKVLTLVPYQLKMMKLDLMSTDQRKWLNKFNEEIREEVGAELKRQGRMKGFYWMMDNTKHIPENGSNIITISYSIVLLRSFILSFSIFLFV